MVAYQLSKETECEVLGITVTYGNSTLNNCLQNTKIALSLLNWDIDVYPGADNSIL
jgi:inosine-uridine nucleoside N-ribohydrolase